MHAESKKFPLIYIEGNVGVGKSTLLQYLNQSMRAKVVYEPVQLWQNIDHSNLLEQFFQNPQRWSYTCQMYILLTRIDQILQEVLKFEHNICFMERSVYSGRYCFAQVAHEMNWMNDMEWALYQKIWDREIHQIVQPAGFIYLKTTAQICFDRIKSRGRSEEKVITLDYLNRLQQKYDNWFLHKQGIADNIVKIPSLILDFSNDVFLDETMQNALLSQVQTFLKQLN